MHKAATKITAYLKDQGLTQAEFAARVGITQAAVSKIVLAQRSPRRETVVALVGEMNGLLDYRDFYDLTDPHEGVSAS